MPRNPVKLGKSSVANFGAADDAAVAGVVEDGDVAGAQPPVAGDGLAGPLGVVPVPVFFIKPKFPEKKLVTIVAIAYLTTKKTSKGERESSNNQENSVKPSKSNFDLILWLQNC